MRAVVTLLALMLSTFAYVTAETLPIGLLPLIADDLGSTVSEVGLLVTVYGLVVVLTSVPLTKITHRMPRRLLLCLLLAIFVVGNAASALLDGYGPLMGARIVVAMSQAVFWSVVTPAAAALFSAGARPRAVSLLYAGSTLGALAGVPAGTWIGQQAGWRVAFLALSVVGALILVAVLVLMPGAPPGQAETAFGSRPDAGRYWTIVVYTALAVAGAFVALTYISPFLTEVSGFGESAVGPLLFVRGLAGLAGVFAAGWMVARNGWLTMVVTIGLQAVALLLQWVFGTSATMTVITLAAAGFSLAAMASGLGVRAMETAPGSTDMASAGTSTAFNVGITAGALLGSLLIPVAGVRSVALAGAVLSLLAFVVVLLEPRLSTRRRVRADSPSRSPSESSAAGW
ncbi:MFS transporter [Actinoplanes sp. DH11]|uniref:MFS transporter n=1 Tax=Actinoplanes sp. DH11 TaxID=2857011 RepID=UPI001E2964F0|nr:MFS transporter [Actinoplanes sp. DH11]